MENPSSSNNPNLNRPASIPPRGYAQLKKGRVSLQGFVYFITLCTENRAQLLASPEVFTTILSSLNFLEQQGNIVHLCSVVMPDHIHLVIKLCSGTSLEKIMYSFKRFTGAKINKILEKSGRLWQKQYYDHCIRAEESLWEICRYCLENPVRKGIVESQEDYPYAYFDPDKIENE